ncbi:MAG: hypothetical protein A2V72_00655 [Candidatus Nealsonbacteria bacterium RBG_13_37_56]|uniref:Uncharacterized protein n=1 Tax=Candidatus Nealsonbacteria bacterium RBG_13_37_56 TaxID=1801661 RepID=A0A1G2DYD0_9BACT|nr:MAG: hypothetical protein A2V72_00655 [Candidatus Nealsonbacteria bacterium RBG_13_37_56]
MVLFCPPVSVVNAADLSDMSAVLTTLTKNVVADQTILFTTTTGLAADETIILTYESDFSIAAGLDYEDIDLSFDETPDGVCETGDTQMTLAAAPTGATMGVVRTDGSIITFTNGSTAVAGGGEICIQIGTNAAGPGVEQITNPTVVGEYDLAITGTIGAPDSGTIVIAIVDDDSVAVTATVPPSLTFTVTGTALEFGTLSATASRWADASAGNATVVVGTTLEAGTNSTSGYSITINGTTLTSTGTPADTITAMASEATLTPTQEEFGIRITSAGGNGAVDTVYDNSPADSYALVVAAFPDEIAASATQSATTTYSIYYAANIAADTEAHTDYTTTLTYVANGNF